MQGQQTLPQPSTHLMQCTGDPISTVILLLLERMLFPTLYTCSRPFSVPSHMLCLHPSPPATPSSGAEGRKVSADHSFLELSLLSVLLLCADKVCCPVAGEGTLVRRSSSRAGSGMGGAELERTLTRPSTVRELPRGWMGVAMELVLNSSSLSRNKSSSSLSLGIL